MVDEDEQSKLREVKEKEYGEVGGHVPDGAVVAFLASRYLSEER